LLKFKEKNCQQYAGNFKNSYNNLSEKAVEKVTGKIMEIK
jgi:hypothetical protein